MKFTKDNLGKFIKNINSPMSDSQFIEWILDYMFSIGNLLPDSTKSNHSLSQDLKLRNFDVRKVFPVFFEFGNWDSPTLEDWVLQECIAMTAF